MAEKKQKAKWAKILVFSTGIEVEEQIKWYRLL